MANKTHTEVYAEWLKLYGGTTKFEIRNDSSDYNQHTELVESTPEMDAALSRMQREAGLIS